jgi:hypothetical protein
VRARVLLRDKKRGSLFLCARTKRIHFLPAFDSHPPLIHSPTNKKPPTHHQTKQNPEKTPPPPKTGGFNPQFFPSLASVQALFSRGLTAASFVIHVAAINLFAARHVYNRGALCLFCALFFWRGEVAAFLRMNCVPFFCCIKKHKPRRTSIKNKNTTQQQAGRSACRRATACCSPLLRGRWGC